MSPNRSLVNTSAVSDYSKEYTNYFLRTYIEAKNINANYTQPLTHNVENTKGSSRVMFTF